MLSLEILEVVWHLNLGFGGAGAEKLCSVAS